MVALVGSEGLVGGKGGPGVGGSRGGALQVRAVQGKIDGEQWKEMGRRWRGSERRQSFWRVETVQKLISDVGRKSGKKYNMSATFLKINLQKLLRASSPHSKSCFRKLAASQKEKPKKKLEKVGEKVGKGFHSNFQKQPFEPSGYL